MMNKLGASKFVEFGSVGLALLSIVMVVTVSSAPAKERKAKRSGTGSQVVTHISFNGLSAVDVATQQQVDEKPYLYVQRGREEGISVVDITKSRFLSVQLSRALAGRGREWRPATSPIAMSSGKPLSAMIRISGGA
jgi:hypothetical protein